MLVKENTFIYLQRCHMLLVFCICYNLALITMSEFSSFTTENLKFVTTHYTLIVFVSLILK